MPNPNIIQFPFHDRPRRAAIRLGRGDVIVARWPWPGAMAREGYAHRPCLVLDVEARDPDFVLRLAPGVSAVERPPQGLDLACTAQELRGVREVEEPPTFVLGRCIDVPVTHPALVRDGEALVTLGRLAPEVMPRLEALVARLNVGLALMGGAADVPDRGRPNGWSPRATSPSPGDHAPRHRRGKGGTARAPRLVPP